MVEENLSFRKKNPIIFAGLILILSTVVLLGCSILASQIYFSIPVLKQRTIYLAQFMVDGLGLIYAIYLVKKLGLQYIWGEHKTSFLRGIGTGGYFAVVGIINLLSLTENLGKNIEVQPVIDILFFVGAMGLIGITEEVLCRGVLSNLLYERYGHTKSGIKYCVIVSGILFGMFHLSNLSAAIPPTGVLVQVIATSAMGMMFTAIYYRTRNIWVVAFLHAFNDFAALIASGIFNQGTIADTIGSYTVFNLIGIIPMILVTCFLLRRSKLEEMLDDTQEEDPLRSKYHRGVAVYLAIVIGAVVALSLNHPSSIYEGEGSYYNQNSEEEIEIPKAGEYIFDVNVADLGFPVGVDVVIRDPSGEVAAGGFGSFGNYQYHIQAVEGKYTITVYLCKDKEALKDQTDQQIHAYDEEKIKEVEDQLPDQQLDSYGAKISMKVTEN